MRAIANRAREAAKEVDAVAELLQAEKDGNALRLAHCVTIEKGIVAMLNLADDARKKMRSGDVLKITVDLPPVATKTAKRKKSG